MKKAKQSPLRTFAIQISCRGFGYVILEGAEKLVDWGVKQATQSGQRRTIEVVADLIAQYRPHHVLLEDIVNEAHRRSPRAVLLTKCIVEFGAVHGLNQKLVSAMMIKETFQRWGASTKEDRARVISERLPILAPQLPPPRKPWMSEDSRMSIFSAAAIAFTFLDTLPGQNLPEHNRDQDDR